MQHIEHSFWWDALGFLQLLLNFYEWLVWLNIVTSQTVKHCKTGIFKVIGLNITEFIFQSVDLVGWSCGR